MSRAGPAPFPEATKTVGIRAAPATVWRALTDPAAMPRWMSDEPLEVATDWAIGGPIVMRGLLHGRIRFENRGVVQAFEPERLLQYTHWNTLSARAMPDVPGNHAVLRFALSPEAGGTRLELQLRNMADEAVRGHLAFYWDTTLAILKEYCEARSADPGPAPAALQAIAP